MEAKECDTCQFLLHYEQDKDSRKYDLPRCSIEFRDGSKILHPCPDYLRRQNEYRRSH